jgi:hypothetical protein
MSESVKISDGTVDDPVLRDPLIRFDGRAFGVGNDRRALGFESKAGKCLIRRGHAAPLQRRLRRLRRTRRVRRSGKGLTRRRARGPDPWDRGAAAARQRFEDVRIVGAFLFEAFTFSAQLAFGLLFLSRSRAPGPGRQDCSDRRTDRRKRLPHCEYPCRVCRGDSRGVAIA